MNNKILPLILLPVAIIFAVWGVNFLLTAHVQLRNIVLGGAVIALCVTAIKRSLTLDFKAVVLLVWGFALAGKGFAYISPAPPIYITEIIMIVCLFSSAISGRIASTNKFRGAVPKVLMLYLIYSGLMLLIDYKTYSLMAIRDSAVAYYGLFFFLTVDAFGARNNLKYFRTVCVVAGVLAGIASIGRVTGLWYAMWISIPASYQYMVPFKDAYIGHLVAFSCCLAVFGIRRKNMLMIISSVILSTSLLVQQTSVALAFLVVVGFCIVFGKLREMVLVSLTGVILMIGIFTMVSVVEIEYISELDAVKTLSETGDERAFRGSTTQWRLNWWISIAKQVIEEDPVFGLGFGADIKSDFWLKQFGKTISKDKLEQGARYPHNVFFTVLGRQGFLGVFLFTLYLFFALRLCVKFARLFLRRRNMLFVDAYCVMAYLGGLVNAFTQSTYESPYAAVSHWVFLAYIFYRVEIQSPSQQFPDDERQIQGV